MSKIKPSHLAYMEFQNRENSYRHHHYDEEMKQYELLKQGDPSAIEECDRMFTSSIVGKLSQDPLRHFRYLFVASITLATRFAIEGGLDAETAYNSSDLYINRMDSCDTIEEICQLNRDMFSFFVQGIASLKKRTVTKSVQLCMDYINLHLHEPMTVTDLSKHIGLNQNYLSTLFKKETGTTISSYIRIQRVKAAENMLKFSNLSFSEISSYLCFSSQSHFIRVFRQETGYTPSEYRKHFFRNELITSEEQETK